MYKQLTLLLLDFLVTARHLKCCPPVWLHAPFRFVLEMIR